MKCLWKNLQQLTELWGELSPSALKVKLLKTNSPPASLCYFLAGVAVSAADLTTL